MFPTAKGGNPGEDPGAGPQAKRSPGDPDGSPGQLLFLCGDQFTVSFAAFVAVELPLPVTMQRNR